MFTQFRKVIMVLALPFIGMQLGVCQFTPGEGGSLPAFTPFTAPPNKIGGLHISTSDQENIFFGSGTRPVVDLEFPEPSVFGADSYTLQYSTDGGSSWANYQHNGADLTTTWNNFSLNFYEGYLLRLLVNGGPKNGYTSNEVFAPLSGVATYFSQWGLDESMYISGVMAPSIGRGLEAYCNVKRLSDGTEVNGALTYQWYRVNPVSYEMTPIEGADTLKYITTVEDAGYKLCLRATGDEVNAGGFIQIISNWENLYPNKAFTNNVSSTGFTLNLYKSVNDLKVSELVLYDTNYEIVPINGISQGVNASIYNISANLDLSKSPYQLKSSSPFWIIMSEMHPGMPHMFEGVNIDVPTNIEGVFAYSLQVYPIPATNNFGYKSNLTINQLSVYNVNGIMVYQSNLNKNVGEIETSGLGNGIYFVKFTTSQGEKIKKIQVVK